MQTTRNILAGRFGSRWSTMWAQAGFINASTSIPTRIEERLGLALSLANFFMANPSYEVATMNVTAAQAAALRNAEVSARQTLSAADVALKTKGTADSSAFDELSAMIRALIKIIGATLANDDPRWLAFGLQMPATVTTPGKPVNVTATLDDMGNILVQCDPAPLAMRYRWRMLRVGIDLDYALAASTSEPMANIPGVLPGMTAQIIV